MNAYDLISIVLAFILFCFECFILYNISSVIQFLAWHSITLLILVAFLYWVYRQKENLLYPLLLLVSALGAGPFGLGAFFLMAILRPVFSLFASSTALWFEGLFPEKNLPLFEEITQRIKSHWDDYSHQSETSSFPNLFTYGSLSDKQKVLDAIIENFQPSYSLILKEALKDPENVVRIQAAAIITKINTDFENKMKRLEKLHLESPKDLDILLQLAEHTDAYAFSGILSDLEQSEAASLAVRYYRRFLQSKPDNFNVWLAVGRLLFYQKDYESFIAWFEEGKQKFGSLPTILNLWYLESLYKLERLDQFTNQLREV